MFEIFRQFLEYARFKLTDVGFGIFIYLARHMSDLISGAFKYDEHVFFGISSLPKLGDTRVFLIAEALDSSVDFVEQNKVIFGERLIILALYVFGVQSSCRGNSRAL